MQKFTIYAPVHRHTTLSGYIFTTKAYIDNRKNLIKQQYLLHVSSQYGELGRLTTEIGLPVWGTPGNFNGCHVWKSPGLVHYICTFGGLLPPDGILPGAKFTLRPSLAFSYLPA